MSQCVKVGDEALMLCILNSKIGTFLKAKQAISEGKYNSKKRGRKRGSTATETPEELAAAYNKFREKVQKVRRSEKNMSWELKLREWANDQEMVDSTAAAVRRKNFNNMEFEWE